MDTQSEEHQQIEPVKATDFMTPEQRREAVAQILATVGLRILKAEDEQNDIQ